MSNEESCIVRESAPLYVVQDGQGWMVESTYDRASADQKLKQYPGGQVLVYRRSVANEDTEQLIERLENWCEAYPPDVFTPLEGSSQKPYTGDYDTVEKRNLITRASAGMGRHMIERALKPAVAELRRLSGG